MESTISIGVKATVDSNGSGLKQATPRIRETIARLKALRALVKSAEQETKELTKEVLAYAGEAPGVVKFNGEALCVIKGKTRTGIDAEMLRAKHPEIAAECSKATAYLTVECL